MEGVEDIPGTALHEGIQWDVGDVPRVPRRARPPRVRRSTSPRSLPHAPLRALRDGRARRRATRTPPPTTSPRWPRTCATAIAAGARRASRRRASLNHKTLDGELVPGTFAAADELVGLAQAMVDAGGGLFEVVPDAARPATTPALILGEVELLAEVSKATGVAGLVPAWCSRIGAPDLWREQLDAVARGQRRRRHARSRRSPRAPGGMLLGAGQLPPASCAARPTAALEDTLSLDELLAELRKPEVKAPILAEDDLPADPRRQFEALAERRRTCSTSIVPARRPARLRADRRAARSPASPRPPGVDPWEVLYDHARRRRAAARRRSPTTPTATHDHAARDARPPRHRDRPLRRRRPRAR